MLYFITINYKSKVLVEKLIQSINSNIKKPYQIIIINNSSEEESIHTLNSDIVTVVEAGSNVGFGRACNMGIEKVHKIDEKALIWLINPDVTLDCNSLDYVLKCFAKDSSITILGTKTRDTQGHVWFRRGDFNPWVGSLNHEYNELEEPNPPIGTMPCRWVSGCSMIINLSKFKNPPFFDPEYFLYCEDADFCLRYAQQGYRIAVTKAVLVTHQVSAITDRNKVFKFQEHTYSKLYFLKQHAVFITYLLHVCLTQLKVIYLWFSDREMAVGRWRGLKKHIMCHWLRSS